jgi:hypothetical protein
MWGNTVANKNYVGKYCNNPQCFKEKKLRSKIDKDHFEEKKDENSLKKSKKPCRETL